MFAMRATLTFRQFFCMELHTVRVMLQARPIENNTHFSVFNSVKILKQVFIEVMH